MTINDYIMHYYIHNPTVSLICQKREAEANVKSLEF